jgi:LruC domain-containing protein
MKTRWQLRGTLLCLLAAAAFMVQACGGSASKSNPDPLQGVGNLPGGVGNITAGPAPGDFPVAEPIVGASEEAPLGTDPAYNMTAIGGTQFGSSEITEVKGSSAVVIPDAGLDVLDVTMGVVGEQPDWSLTEASFDSGDAIVLYVKYNTYGASMDVTRNWVSEALTLNTTDAPTRHEAALEYVYALDYAIPVTSADFDGTLVVNLFSNIENESSEPFPFHVTAQQTTTVVYPGTPPTPELCWPDLIEVDYTPDNTTAIVGSDKELSNVVLRFVDGKTQKFEGLKGKTGTFKGTGSNAGKKLVGVWVKSGCNFSNDGPGYGEWLPNDGQRDWVYGFAQMGWEDLLTGSDYDYNDFVGRLRVIETRNMAGELLQIDMTVKAIARAAGYDSDFQLNMNGAFPGQNITSTVDQYYADQFNADGSPKRHGNQRTWRSSDGISLPIFTPIRIALPDPPGTNITNGIAGTKFINGDYAEVRIVFATPVPAGSYTPMPYRPELRVIAGGNTTYKVTLWSKKGDWVDSKGRPLAFIIPDSFAWPLEGTPIWTCYPVYNDWIKWVNNSGAEPKPPFWDRAPVSGTKYFYRSAFTN